MLPNSFSCSRLLLVGPYPPPYGGIASHLTSLVPNLKAKGWEDISIISFGDINSIENIPGGIVYRFNIKQNAYKLLFPKNWKYFIASLTSFAGGKLGINQIIKETTKAILVCQIAEKQASNIISIYQADLSLMLLPCAKLWAGTKKIVLTVFGEIYDNYEFIKERKTLFERLLTIPSYVLASSKHCAHSFKKIGINREIIPVYYGIELERFQTSSEIRTKFREDKRILPDEILVLYMGRFNEEMGLKSVLEAAKIILDTTATKGCKIKFVLAGAKGPLSELAQELYTKYSDSIHIMHDVPFSIQPAMYAASDIVLAPSRDQHACMGMSIKEAMAAGKPVIGSISGGIPEAIIHNHNGILISLDDSESISLNEFISSIVYLSQNEEVRNQFGACGRKRAETVFAAINTIDKMDYYFQTA